MDRTQVCASFAGLIILMRLSALGCMAPTEVASTGGYGEQPNAPGAPGGPGGSDFDIDLDRPDIPIKPGPDAPGPPDESACGASTVVAILEGQTHDVGT